MRRAIILAMFLTICGCEDRASDARSTMYDVIRDCDDKTVRYRADTNNQVREFVMTCESNSIKKKNIKQL